MELAGSNRDEISVNMLACHASAEWSGYTQESSPSIELADTFESLYNQGCLAYYQQSWHRAEQILSDSLKALVKSQMDTDGEDVRAGDLALLTVQLGNTYGRLTEIEKANASYERVLKM